MTTNKSKRRASWFNNMKQNFGLKQTTEETKKVFNKSATSYGQKVTVVPGRESHTGNPYVFDDYMKKLEDVKRERRRNESNIGGEACDAGDHPLCDEISGTATTAATADSTKFWQYVRSVLETATKPAGFEGHPDRSEVVPKGPGDYDRFSKKKADTEIINPINPVMISEASNVPLHVVLEELLYATKVGLVYMKWAPFCERCTAPVCTMDWGTDSDRPPVQSYCQGCRYENTIECMSKIKVFFILTQDVFYVLAENFQCTASESIIKRTEAKIDIPASSSGSGWRIFAGCGDDMEYRPKLSAGLYRMHCPIVPTQNYLRVLREATDDDAPCTLVIRHSDLVVRRPGDALTTLTVPHGKVQFDIYPDTMSQWIFWIHEDMDEEDIFYLPRNERGRFLTAYEVLDHPVFQLLFQDQIDSIIYDAVSQMKVSDV